MEILDDYTNVRAVAIVVGVLYVVKLMLPVLCDLLSFFRAYVLAPLGIGRKNLLNYGSWAVVTGASEGIGRGYALELARRGLNVVLMSRSVEKLNKVAEEIKERYGRECRVVSVDFSGGRDIYEELSKKLLGLDIGVLVNNVGMTVLYPDLLNNIPEERLYNVVSVNCYPIIQMTSLLLPQMMSRNGGIIVNLSSATSISVTAQATVYSATKIFVDYFSHGLHKEYGDKGIIVQNVRPFFVATAMTGMKKSNIIVANSESYARSALTTIGIQRDTFGCISHAIQGFIATVTPEWIKDIVVHHESNKWRARWHQRNSRKTKH